MKSMMLVVSAVVSLGMVGCALEDTQPAENEDSSDVQIQPRYSAADVCWSTGSAIRNVACGTIELNLPLNSSVSVTNSPFFSGCDGQDWVHASVGAVSGDIPWAALCNFR